MKIIEQGVVKEWSIRVRCTGNGNGQEHRACNSLLEVGYGDLFRTMDGASSRFPYYTLKCISCGALTNVPDKDIPQEIVVDARLTANPRPSTNAVYERDFRDRDRVGFKDVCEQDRMHRRK